MMTPDAEAFPDADVVAAAYADDVVLMVREESLVKAALEAFAARIA